MNTADIRNLLIDKYEHSEFRGNTIEIQGAHFLADTESIFPGVDFQTRAGEDWSDNWYKENYDPILIKQIYHTITKLILHYERQAVICMANPDEHTSIGYICTMYIQMFLNDDKLDWHVNMRSNSVERYPRDYTWNRHWQEFACEKLSLALYRNITPGNIYWNAGSFHIYKEDWGVLGNCRTTG